MLDGKDSDLCDRRAKFYLERLKPQVGDYIFFKDITRRIAQVCFDGDVQTCDGGSFYLGNGGAKMSESLYPSLKIDLLASTRYLCNGRFWFFHHDHPMANGGVYVTILVRIWRCAQKAPV